MKYFRIILILIFAVLIVVFSVQNAETVEIRFFTWETETSRVLLMLSCVIIGSLSTLLALLPSLLSKEKKEKHVNQKKDHSISD